MLKSQVKNSIFILFSLLLLTLILVVVFPSTEIAYANSDTATTATSIDSGYVITNFKAIIDCTEGRKAKIDEVIDVYFFENRHGIKRDLTCQSGEDYSKISVDGDEYSIDKQRDRITIKIGDSSRTIQGEHTYKISYVVKMPQFMADPNSLLYNVVPYGFTCKIQDFSVSVKLPAIPKDVLIVSGGYGVQDNNLAVLEGKETNTLTITKKPGVEPSYEQGVSIRVFFDEGVLDKVINLEPLYIFLAGLILLVIALILMFVYGREDKLVEVVSFDPPRNLAPCDIGYLIDGKTENQDITSLFFYWASLGCIEIHEKQMGKKEKDKEIRLLKKKDLPETCNQYEKDIFNSMFIGGDVCNPETLGEVFGLAAVKAKSSISRKYEKTMYTKKSKSLSMLMTVLSIVFIIAACFLADFIKYGVIDFTSAPFGFLVGLIVVGYFALGEYLMKRNLRLHSQNKKTWYFILYGLLGIILALIGMAILSFTLYFTFAKSFCLVICPILTCWISPYIHKRTETYSKLLGEIVGFRNFLVNAEKDQMEALIKDNPEYYYNVLPYAQVLGVSDVFEEKFKDVKMNPPSWYYASDITIFDIYWMNRMMNNVSHIVTARMAEVVATNIGSKVSKYGGGKSGSGFSGGGGFGGGGGSSW